MAGGVEAHGDYADVAIEFNLGLTQGLWPQETALKSCSVKVPQGADGFTILQRATEGTASRSHTLWGEAAYERTPALKNQASERRSEQG